MIDRGRAAGPTSEYAPEACKASSGSAPLESDGFAAAGRASKALRSATAISDLRKSPKRSCDAPQVRGSRDRMIGANAAMEKIEELKKFTLSEREEELLDLVAEAVNDLAAMIPEAECAPQGRWILRQDAGQGVRWHECSKCGTVGSPAWKRCPLCEAKMEINGGVKDETNDERSCTTAVWPGELAVEPGREARRDQGADRDRDDPVGGGDCEACTAGKDGAGMNAPKKIKQGIQCCLDLNGECKDACPYFNEKDCSTLLIQDAIASFQQLEAEREALLKIVSEAGAACDVCRHGDTVGTKCEPAGFLCKECKEDCLCKTCSNASNFEYKDLDDQGG